MLSSLHQSLEEVPEHRTGCSVRCEIIDAGHGALAVLSMRSRSFLAYQWHTEKQGAQNNARSLVGVETIPRDGQMRNLLDPVSPSYLRAPFWEIYERLRASKHPDTYESIGGTLPCSLAGTPLFASRKISCPNCTLHVHDEQDYYSHMVSAAVLVAPAQEHVIALDPEFITLQNGHDKQDCEQQASKGWVKRNAERFAPWKVTTLTDDVQSHQPLCELPQEHKSHFAIAWKRGSHQALYQELELLIRVENAAQTMTTRRWNGRNHEWWEYRWVDQVPIRAGGDVKVPIFPFYDLAADLRAKVVANLVSKGILPITQDGCSS